MLTPDFDNERYHGTPGGDRLEQQTLQLGRRGMGFRQVLEDVRSQCPTDSEMFLELERAEDLKYLFIDSFDEGLTKRLANAIRETASGIQSGKVRSGLLDKPYGTANAIEEYRNSMQELVAVVSEH